MARAGAYGLMAAGLALAACGPLPLPEAERLCATEVAPKAPLSGEGRMGVTSDGFRSGIKLNVNLGATAGDPSKAYQSCVVRRSGQFPTRPWWEIAGGGPGR